MDGNSQPIHAIPVGSTNPVASDQAYKYHNQHVSNGRLMPAYSDSLGERLSEINPTSDSKVNRQAINLTNNSSNRYRYVDNVDNSVTSFGNVGNIIDKQYFTNVENMYNVSEPEGSSQLRKDLVHDWQLPPPTNLFIGRNKELEKMKEYFGIGSANAPGTEGRNQERRVFVLHGLGGSGKTQLALKFAQLYGSWFWRIFYVDASNSDVLEAQFLEMAKQFKAGETAKDALTGLLAQQRNWLLIFDNADDRDFHLGQYFPNGNHGYIIITTRNKGCISYAVESNIHIDELSPEDAARLLIKASKCDDAELPSACVLAEELGYLPLAITQASAYIWQNSTILEYTQLFRERREQILENWNGNAQDQDRPVYTTWDISYRRLDNSAKDFLSICACLHNKGIPKTLFEDGSKRLLELKPNSRILGKSDQDLESWKAILQDHWTADGKWETTKFNDTVSQATSYSFVSVSNHPETSTLLYSLHPLVHYWIRDRLPKERFSLMQRVATKLFCLSIPDGCLVLDYQKRRLLILHAIALYNEPIQELEMSPTDLMRVAEICDESDKWPMAEKFLARAVQAMEVKLGQAHFMLPARANLQQIRLKQERWDKYNELGIEIQEKTKIINQFRPDMLSVIRCPAYIHSGQGQWAGAEELQIEVVESYKTIFGKNHSYTVFAMIDLGIIYCDQGQKVKAMKLLVELGESLIEICNEYHPGTERDVDNLIIRHYNPEQEAEDENVLESRKKILRKDHLDILSTLNNLENISKTQGRCAEAGRLQIEILESYKQIFGKDHPETLLAMTNLAYIYRSQGRWAEAEKLGAYALESFKEIFDKDSKNVLFAMTNLAYIYKSQGRWAEAEKLEVELLESYKNIFGKDNIQTLRVMCQLASIYQKQERWPEAKKQLVEVLENYKRIFGKDNSKTLIAMGNLADIYSSQGRWNKAEKLEIEVLESYKKRFGKDHEYTLAVMGKLACTYLSQKRWLEVEKLVVEALESCKKRFGKDNEFTLMTMDCLEGIYRSQGRWAEAEKLLIKVHEIRKRMLGEGHPDVLKTIKLIEFVKRKKRLAKQRLVLFLISTFISCMALVLYHFSFISTWLLFGWIKYFWH